MTKKMYMKCKFLGLGIKQASMIIAMLVLTLVAQAQNRTVSGKVTDGKGGALVGATVEANKVTTKTDANGDFSISVPQNAKSLTISFIGYKNEIVNIANRNTVSVSLEEGAKEEEAVIVTGYSREKKGKFSGANTVVSGKLIETVPVGSFDQVLQGRSPGIVVNSGSGQPGASANVTIRGISSIQGAGVQPLYVLDGVPIPAGDFQTLNPNDFESVTILRDADAAALYGARGGLGVIVITSKRGKTGAPSFTYRTQYGFTQPPTPNRFDMMNTSEALAYEERLGTMGAAILGPGWIYSKLNPTYATQSPTVQARRDFLLDSFKNNNSDYYNILFRQGISQSHDLNMQGGNERSRYYTSIGVFDQQGIDLNSRLRRYTGRFNIEQTTGKLSIEFKNTMGYSITNQNEGDWLGNSARNPFQIVWRAKPYENPLDAAGNPVFGPSTSAAPKVIGNTLEGIRNSYWQERQMKINSGLTFSYKLNDQITLRNTSGVDFVNEFGLRSINANSYIGSLQTNNNGYHSENARMRANLINTSSIGYAKKFGTKHDFGANAYFEVVKGYNRGLGFFVTNLDRRLTLTGQGAGTIPTGGAATVPQNGSSAKSEFGIVSTFGTLRYTFNDKYTIRGAVRRDGTSRIVNEENKYINTWSAGFVWDAIKEKFLDKQNFFTDLKVRVSYGQTPNIGSIATGGFGLSGGIYGITNYLGPQLPTFGTTTGFAGSTVTGLVPTSPGNPDLKIEYIEKQNYAIDMEFWKRRARVTVDYYRNMTKDLFVNQPLAANSGFGGTNLPINAGKMSNRGVELKVDVDVIKTRDWLVTLGVNHSINKNNIEDLGLVNEYIVGTSIIREGLPYGAHYTIKYLGANPADGRPTWAKQDGSATVNRAEAFQFADFGTWMADNVGSFSIDASYKRFNVRTLFTYQTGAERYNNVESWTTRGIPGYANAVNQNKKLLTEQWQKPGDVKYYQSPLFDRDFSSADIMNANFLRFRNINLSYTIPQVNVGKTKLFNSTKFYVQGQNLMIWSPWRGLDPEDSNNISLNEFPNPRAIVFGIDVNF
jgi:TonB-linked SusC/RagA family outer membrane protein